MDVITHSTEIRTQPHFGGALSFKLLTNQHCYCTKKPLSFRRGSLLDTYLIVNSDNIIEFPAIFYVTSTDSDDKTEKATHRADALLVHMARRTQNGVLEGRKNLGYYWSVLPVIRG
jgi:hypothetical protein